ncbi:MAG: hypothetical protein Fur005_06190 [Roseiflexaceae bacterium]
MQPTNDERTLAALAHASIVANGFSLIGLIAAAVIWATQREKSAYVRGHALQALAFQGAILVLVLLLALSWGLCVSLSLVPMALRPELYSDGSMPGPFWLAVSGVIAPIFFGVLATLYALIGAVQAYRGRPFYYPLIGRLAVKDLAPPAPAAPPLPATPTPDPEP